MLSAHTSVEGGCGCGGGGTVSGNNLLNTYNTKLEDCCQKFGMKIYKDISLINLHLNLLVVHMMITK